LEMIRVPSTSGVFFSCGVFCERLGERVF
jgi:hypothetical protein